MPLRALTLLAVVATTAGLHVLAFAPVGWTALHPVAWVAAFLWFGRLRPSRAFWAGWLVGAAVNMAWFHWIAFLWPRQPLYVRLLALLGYGLVSGFGVGVFAAGWRRVRRASGGWWPAGVAAWFTACEFLSWQMFPNNQGCGWWERSWIFPVTSLTGVASLTFLAILCNALLAAALEGRTTARAWLGNFTVLAAGVAGACGWSALQNARLARLERETPVTRVAMVLPPEYVPGSGEPYVPPLQRLIRSTREVVARDPSVRVAVWPEGAVRSTTGELPDGSVGAMARELGIEVWTGASLDAGQGTDHRNAAVRVDATGTASPAYDKCVLAPMGERMPFSEYLPWLAALRGKPNMTHGAGPVVYETPAGRLAFAICYESIQYAHVRAVMRHRPDLLVVVSSDRWANRSACCDQHYSLAAVNAAQCGVTVVRCSAGGVCGVTDPAGRSAGRSADGPAVVCDVRPGRLPAPYVWLGDWFAWGCVAASAAALGRRKVWGPRG